MPALERILVPVDFSERAPGAAHFARTLANRYRSELTLLHVVAPPDYAIGAPELSGVVLGDWTANRLAEAKSMLENFLPDAFTGLTVNRVVVEGDPSSLIVEHAHEGKFSLLVMPTHGYGPFRRFILGSVTAKVLHDVECPVLTGVHMEEAPPELIHFGTVMCAIDLGDRSLEVLKWAADFAADFNATLKIVHAVPMLESGQSQYFDPDWRVMLFNRAREQVEKVQQEAGTEAEMILESGDVAKVVDSAAKAAGADLLVIGRSSSEGILGRLRANAYSIIRESPCPVVSV